ncbi:hypothetical protein LMG19083_04955 [Ralstonia psammae]|uniref:Uncharacterized protein n=1 Tax=Ralstonia psammae TaxID=3058598 RepID=A0ABN9JHW5_9RALS|nr:hypothetical protein LMG19083_04955 [Ralstonia sp. LMG 19083]
METVPDLMMWHACDAVYRRPMLAPGESAHCEMCEATLQRAGQLGNDGWPSLTVAAAIAYAIASVCTAIRQPVRRPQHGHAMAIRRGTHCRPHGDGRNRRAACPDWVARLGPGPCAHGSTGSRIRDSHEVTCRDAAVKHGRGRLAWHLGGRDQTLGLSAGGARCRRTAMLGRADDSAILEGVAAFQRAGSPGIALVSFIASVAVPCAKVLASSYCWQQRSVAALGRAESVRRSIASSSWSATGRYSTRWWWPSSPRWSSSERSPGSSRDRASSSSGHGAPDHALRHAIRSPLDLGRTTNMNESLEQAPAATQQRRPF